MRASRLIVCLLGFLLAAMIVARPVYLRAEFFRAAPLVNSPPVANDDSYTKHGGGAVGPLLANDSDPDNDPLQAQIVTFPTHGNLTGIDGNSFGYQLTNISYVGTDSFTYQACQTGGVICSNVATVTITLVNQAPVPGPDQYAVRAGGIIGPMFANDYDPDGDSFNGPSIVVGAAHGTVFGLAHPPYPVDFKQYVPTNPNFTGTDSFQYRIDDFLGAFGTTTVTLFVLGDGEGNGTDSCNSVGEPVNVANGNMYVQQQDFSLSSLGHPIDITRTYNSNSQRIGLFGRGWSTEYDSALVVYDNNLVRLNEADGRASYFGRPMGSSGAYAALEGDFHGQLTPGGSGFTLSMADGSSSQFNSAGKLLTLTDRNNNTTTLAYDGNGFLSSVTDAFGRALTLTPDANGQILSISDTMGTIATYTYGAGSRLLSVTYADSSAFQFGYDANVRLTTVTDALGNIVESHTYDGQGRALTSEKHGGVEHYTLSYVSNTETHVTDGLGHLTKYTFDKSQGRALVTRVEGECSCGSSGTQVQTWTYDSQLNMTSKTDALGHVTSYTYDNNGNTLTETDATGTVTNTYNQFSQPLTRTDQLGGITTNTYDVQGNRLTSKDALDNTTTFTYDARGELLTATDARGSETTSTYDAVGNLIQQEDANGIATLFFFDARSRLTKKRDGLSRDTLYEYDPVGRMSKITHPDNSFVTFTYDLAGRRTVVTDERGNAMNYAYDAAYRITGVTDALNHTTSYGYDAMSNVTSSTDALGRVTDYEYDDFNRLVKLTYPAATVGATRLFATMAYDTVGNVTQRTDPAGRTTSYEYDDVNRVESSTDADGKTTSFTYDDLSRVTSVTDALGQQYEFGHDAMGRQTSVTRAAASMSMIYDEVGNRIQRTDYNGAVTDYAYDDLNRLTTIMYPSRTVTYDYTVLGQLLQATNENGTVTMSYDNRNRLSTVTDPFNYLVSYSYDAAGNRTALSVNNATYATYTYDAADRLTNIKDAANLNFPHSYDAVNRLTSRSAPSGVTTTEAYDGLDRLTALTHAAGATTVIGNEYEYDDAGNINSWTNANGNHAYDYDLVNRLLAANNSQDPNESYSYDEVGNRTTSHLAATYEYEPLNKLIQTDSSSYQYDTNGNLTLKMQGGVQGGLGEVLLPGARSSQTLIWNEENQLAEVDLSTGEEIFYTYDALGRRIQRTTRAGADERYIYDGNDVLLDLNANGSVATTYFNGPGVDNHLRQTSATSGVSYYLTDHLGSTAALTDAAGNVVEQLAYDSFGNSAGSAFTRYTYSGRERDPDTDLFYNRLRWYDPTIARFISEDPIGLIGGLNLYAYVDNDPINGIDPFGLQRLAPLGRNGLRRRDVDRAALERLMTPRGGRGLPDSVKGKLDLGCIGLTMAYQGFDGVPENAPWTNCYLEEGLAKARKCPRCCRNLVFAKQGDWNPHLSGDEAPKPDSTGRVPTSSVWGGSGGGHFNYIVWFESTRSYAWMNVGRDTGSRKPQYGSIASFVPANDYTGMIWCSTCIRKNGKGG